MHVCAQFNKCSLPSVPFLGSTWLRRRGTVTLPPAVLLSLPLLPPFVPAPRVSLIRMQSRRTSRASRRAWCSSRFRLRAVQIYDSRDFYLIPTPISSPVFVSSRENFPRCIALPPLAHVRIRAIDSRLLRANTMQMQRDLSFLQIELFFSIIIMNEFPIIFFSDDSNNLKLTKKN